jgi:hypothetical protein
MNKKHLKSFKIIQNQFERRTQQVMNLQTKRIPQIPLTKDKNYSFIRLKLEYLFTAEIMERNGIWLSKCHMEGKGPKKEKPYIKKSSKIDQKLSNFQSYHMKNLSLKRIYSNFQASYHT